MLEFLLCSLVTILPDYLFRRYAQGKRPGHELTLFSVWYELRWGITLCLMLTILLLTVIFYYHPATTRVVSYFRTVTILSEGGGRVAEIYVGNHDTVEAGAPLFRLDDASQRAAVERAERQIAEIDAALGVAQAEVEAALAMVRQAESAFRQVADELGRKRQLVEMGSAAVTAQEIDRLEGLTGVRQGELDAASANRRAVEVKLATLLPAQRATAEAALKESRAALDKTLVHAGVSGTIQQFTLRVGDIVNPVLRPAGILVPADAGRVAFQAGFDQLSAQVIAPGMLAEMACASKPFTIIPMVVTEMQDVIATGQIRPSDTLLDAAQLRAPGTLTVFLEPLYAGDTADIPPGSACIANAYTTSHGHAGDGTDGALARLAMHAVEAVGVVHATVLRLKAAILPIRALVLSGH